MKTKAFLLSIFMLLLSSAFLTAQPGSLTGRLVSLDENKPLAGAHVIIESEKSWQQKASISGENGVFNLYRIPEGAYSPTISFVGYHSYKRQM